MRSYWHLLYPILLRRKAASSLCACDQATPCPLGRIASSPRCTVEELRAALIALQPKHGRSEWDWDKEVFIQWKGTDACMDLHCPKCGYHNHYDGMFGYAVECAKCKSIWIMSQHVTFYEPDPKDENEAYWIKNPLHGADYDPENDDGEPLEKTDV